MTQEFAIYIVRETLFTALMIAAPMLLAGLLTGLTISLLQSLTQVNEMTLTFIPKILAVVTILILFAPWMINIMVSFVHMIYGHVTNMG